MTSRHLCKPGNQDVAFRYPSLRLFVTAHALRVQILQGPLSKPIDKTPGQAKDPGLLCAPEQVEQIVQHPPQSCEQRHPEWQQPMRLRRILSDVAKRILSKAYRRDDLVFPAIKHLCPRLQNRFLGHRIESRVDPVQDNDGGIVEGDDVQGEHGAILIGEIVEAGRSVGGEV